MIILENICKRFEIRKKFHIEVLSDINLNISPGKITGLIGLNGAGKTTLIKVIAELYRPTAGSIDFDFDVSNVIRKTSFLSSEHGLYKNLSSEKLIRYFGQLQNPLFDYNGNDVKNLIELLEMKEILNKKISVLSSGMRQKLLILLAFINDPEIILLDEPANYLDFLGKKQLDDLVNIFKEKNKYIVYATHNLHDICLKCDKCAFLHNGHLVFYDEMENIYSNYKSNNLEEIVFKIINNKKNIP